QACRGRRRVRRLAVQAGVMNPQDARALLASAELICSADEVSNAVSRLAGELNAALRELNPLVVSVMGGAVVFTGQLLPQLDFPLEFDYVHASRYGDETAGRQLRWVVEPRSRVAGRPGALRDGCV